MAVHKSKVSRSRRNMRRSHDGLQAQAISVDIATGETHLRHHISPNGYYRGKKILDKSTYVHEDKEDEIEKL